MSDKNWKDETIAQSEGALKSWELFWRINAAAAKKRIEKEPTSQKEIMDTGIGRKLICCAYGPSLSEHIYLLKNKPDDVDIICVDKAFKPLMSAGVDVKYVLLCDANVSVKYMEGIDTSNIVLISNVCANKAWFEAWKGKVYFFLNKDSIGTQRIFGPISGCRQMIPASSNVSNSMFVFSYQIMGYDYYALVGFDYSWGSKYYGMEDNHDKKFYMNNGRALDIANELVHTSNNLNFSCEWLKKYIMGTRARVFNCSGRGLLSVAQMSLKDFYSFEPKRIHRKSLAVEMAENYVTAGGKS